MNNESLIRELQKYKKETDEILDAAEIGLWSLEFEEGKEPRLYGNKTMDFLLGISHPISPEDRFILHRAGIYKDDEKRFLEYSDSLISRGKAEITYRWYHPQKGITYVRCGGNCLRNFNGRVILKGYHQDVTDIMMFQKQQEESLEKALADAKQANIAKSEFLSRMSHDIRTPLNGMLGMLEIAKDHFTDINRLKECHDKIEVSANYLLGLISDILDMSKLEAGKMEFARESFDIRDIVRSCATIITPLATEHGIKVFSHMDENIKHPYVIGSPLHFRQILINISTNAIKYNKPNGTLTATFKECKSLIPGKVMFEIVVADTGIGMSEKFMKHMFDAFTQEHNEARTKNQGSGLGLAIVKKMVQGMGGSINVKSKLGVGTEFVIRIPFDIDDDYEEKTETKKEIKNCSFEGMKMLLVEDNDLNIEIAKYMLEKMGILVDVAMNGQQAVDMVSKCEAAPYKLILMDIMMPVMDGYTAAKTIRGFTNKSLANIPIIAMTANAYAEDVAKAKESGMNAHIAKPVNTDVLQKTIIDVLEE